MPSGVPPSRGIETEAEGIDTESVETEAEGPEAEAEARPAVLEQAVATAAGAAAGGAVAVTPEPPVLEPQPRPKQQQTEQPATAAADADEAGDVAAAYPAPTLSSKRLLDSSENWLPVPDAEAEQPSDLAWRRAIPAACFVKPPGDGAAAEAAEADEPTKKALRTKAQARTPAALLLLAAALLLPLARRP